MFVYQTIEKQDLHVFIRDLSEKVTINLKHKIEDFDKEVKPVIAKKKLSKKDIIRQEQTKKRERKWIQEDQQKINYFFKDTSFLSTTKRVYQCLQSLKTAQSKIEFQFRMLCYYWDMPKKNKEQLFGLYFQLLGKETTPEQKSILHKIKTKIEDYEIYLYMLKNLGHILPPLNFWEQSFEFDDWQKKALQFIRSGKSVIIQSPTSSGKSFIALSSGIFHKKILY